MEILDSGEEEKLFGKKEEAKEEYDLEELAFLSGALDLEEHQIAGARREYAQFGTTPKEDLIKCIERNGRIDGVMESALLLPLNEYYEVKEVWDNATPVETTKKIRRRKKK